MALPNGDLITTVFDPQMAYPVDKRMQVDTLNSRDSISMFIRWEGMQVYVLENSKIYILQGGRSNEYWKELGTGTGTGGTTFVGQFATDDLLPTTGRSPGDYAFVGTGEDFVQYNWDSIANEWVMAEGQTDLASEHFHIGYKTPLRRPVIFRRDQKDVIIEDSGDIIIDTGGESANFILTDEVESVRGIISATDGREIHLTNRTGADVLLVDEYTSIDAENRFNFGGSDYTLGNGVTISLKSESDRWVLGPVNEVAFSDHLDSVGATSSIGPDGLEVITGVFDKNTGEEVSFKEYEDTPAIVDGTIFIQLNGKYFADSEFLSTRKISAKKLGVTTLNSPGTNRANLSTAIRLCANLRASLQITEDIEINGEILMTGEDSGVTIEGVGGAEIKRTNVSENPAARGGVFFVDSTESPAKDITFSNLVLNGNKDNIDTSNGSGILIYTGSNDPQNINIRNVRAKNMKSSGINIYGKGVILTNVFAHNCDSHGVVTNTGSNIVTLNNIVAYENGGRGVDISGGECIGENIWAFRNTAGGMKTSFGTEKCILSNIICEDNTGFGFNQTGSSTDSDLLILDNIICKNNGLKGIAISSGVVRKIGKVVLINNNTSGVGNSDNSFENAEVDYVYVEQPETTTGVALACAGNTVISQIDYNNCGGALNVDPGCRLTIKSGIVKNTNGPFINRTGNSRNVFIDLRDVRFVDTTEENTQAIAFAIGGDSAGSLINCDFTANPGQKVSLHQTSDVLVKDCRGFSHSAVITNNANYSFFKGDRHRYLRFTGNANTITVNADTFEAGDEIKGEIQGGTKTITAGAGVTLRGANMRVSQGERFSIKFESPTNALVTVYISSSLEKAKLTVTNTDLNELREFFEYSLAATPFINSPDDLDTWYVRSIKGDSHTIYLQTAWSRTGTGEYYTRVYASGAWTSWVKVGGFQLDANGNAVIDNTKKVGNGVADSDNWIQYGNGANIYNVPTGQQHIFRQNGVTVAGITGYGKLFVEGVGKGIILKSPDGTQYEITVPDGGASLTITEI